MLGLGTAKVILNNIGRGLMAAGGTTLANPAGWFTNWRVNGPNVSSGPVSVTEQTALNYLTVFNCVSLISSTSAALPLITYKRNGKYTSRATERPEYRILKTEFNPDMSALTAREAGTAHLLTWGNSYSQIVTNKSGSTLQQIQPQGPDIVTVIRNSRKKLGYEIRDRETNKVVATLPAEEVLHVPGLGFDGIVGYSPIRIAKTAIKCGMAMDAEAERFITRGIRPPGAIKFPVGGKKFKTEAEAIQWREAFKRIHASDESSLNILVLEDGADWMSLGVDPETAQLLESRKFSRKEICGLYRVPPHMIGDVEGSTSWGSGIGEQKDGFVTFTLLNWLKRIEAEYNRKLFGGDDGEYYCEHLVDGLLRGDILKRTQALQIQHMRGIITDNQWRELENMNPMDGGDVRHYPLAEGRIDIDGNDITPAQPAMTRPAAPAKVDPTPTDPNAPTE